MPLANPSKASADEIAQLLRVLWEKGNPSAESHFAYLSSGTPRKYFIATESERRAADIMEWSSGDGLFPRYMAPSFPLYIVIMPSCTSMWDATRLMMYVLSSRIFLLVKEGLANSNDSA